MFHYKIDFNKFKNTFLNIYIIFHYKIDFNKFKNTFLNIYIMFHYTIDFNKFLQFSRIAILFILFF